MIGNNASRQFTCSYIFVVSVKNASADQIMGDMFFGVAMTGEFRSNKITNGGTFTVTYSNNTATVTNTAGMYQGFMVLYA